MTKILMVIAAFAILFTVYACKPPEAPPAAEADRAAEPARPEPAVVKGTIVEVLGADPNHSTLVDMVNQAELVDELNAEGPLTIFAPTNEAFAKLTEEQLTQLREDRELLRQTILNHVAEGTLGAAEITEATSIATLAGQTIPVKVDGDIIDVGAATVTRTDIKAANGVIHVIDVVLIPAPAPAAAPAPVAEPAPGAGAAPAPAPAGN